MKLSQKTVEIIKNFSAINPGLLFKPGNQLKTVSVQKNVMAVANIEENIENEFAVYDLNEFLNTWVSSAGGDDATEQKFVFDDKLIVFTSKQGKRKINYAKSSENMIVTPPDKEIQFPEPEITIQISQDTKNWISSQALNFRLDCLCIKSDGHNIFIQTSDSTGSVPHSAEENIGDSNGEQFLFTFKLDSLNLLDGDYDVSLSSKGVSHWKNKTVPVEYWVTTEKGSFYQKA